MSRDLNEAEEAVEEIDKPVKGMMDVPPEKQSKYNYILQIMKKMFRTYGYSEVRVPIIENVEVYWRKSGDAIRRRMYIFEDQGRREICLRPEVTASIARAYVNKWRSYRKPLKFYYVGPSFRYEQPQFGRYREFYHAGVEFIGPNSPIADAEIICLAADIVKNLGLKDYSINIGHLGFFLDFFESLKDKIVHKALNKTDAIRQKLRMEYLQDRLISCLDELKNDFDKIEKQFLDMGIRPDEYKPAAEMISKLNKLKGRPSEVLPDLDEAYRKLGFSLNAYNNLKEIIKWLNLFGVSKEEITLDLGLTRGLAYYTGMVFEIEASSLGAQKQICGGGRYDQLMGTLKSSIEPTPALGFAFGLERILLALEEEGRSFLLSSPLDIYIVVTSRDVLDYAISILQKLRKAGIRAGIDYMDRRMRSSLSHASKMKIPYTIIVGPKEKESGKVILRDMPKRKEKVICIKDIHSIFNLKGNPS